MNKKKNVEIAGMGIYASSERNHVEGYNSEYVYYLYHDGGQAICDMSAEEVKEVIACLQQALTANGEGGEA